VVHALDTGAGFSAGTKRRVHELKRIYEMNYGIEEIRERLYTERR